MAWPRQRLARQPTAPRQAADARDDDRGRHINGYVAAMSAGDWQTASRLARQTVPLHGQMGLSIVDKNGDSIVMTMELTDSVRGLADGSIHGGILATFADVASAFCLDDSYDTTRLIPVTTDMHIRYYRQPKAGPLTAHATVVHRGSRLLSAECSITDADDRTLARSTATYMLIPYADSIQQLIEQSPSAAP
jgi:uncharacterized protein (TIGR00369 family)